MSGIFGILGVKKANRRAAMLAAIMVVNMVYLTTLNPKFCRFFQLPSPDNVASNEKLITGRESNRRSLIKISDMTCVKSLKKGIFKNPIMEPMVKAIRIKEGWCKQHDFFIKLILPI
jgi:hypothetical protein